MSEWQPIETAPKDGTEIVLYGPYPANNQGLPTDRVTAGFWLKPSPPVIGDCGGECRCPEYGDPEYPRWCTMHGGSDEGWMSSDGGFTTEWPPTHWKPLPPPPSDAMLRARSGQTASTEQPMQHVAYFDEGKFHWMSGIKPRDCELYACARSGEEQ